MFSSKNGNKEYTAVLNDTLKLNTVKPVKMSIVKIKPLDDDNLQTNLETEAQQMPSTLGTELDEDDDILPLALETNDDDTEEFIEKDNGFIFEISKMVLLPSIFWESVHDDSKNSTVFSQQDNLYDTVKTISFYNSLLPKIQIYGKTYKYDKPIKSKNELQNLLEHIDKIEKCYGFELVIHGNCVGYYKKSTEDVTSCSVCREKFHLKPKLPKVLNKIGTDGDKEKKKREESKWKRDCFASEESGAIDKIASMKGLQGSSTSNKKTPMLSSKQKLRVVSKATISASEADRSGGEVKKQTSARTSKKTKSRSRSRSGSRTGLA